MERGHWGKGCFEYVVVLCLRGIALGSSVMRWRTSVTAVVDRCVNTICPHLSDRHTKRWHWGSKTRTWREKTRRAENLLKEPPTRCKRRERLLKYLS